MSLSTTFAIARALAFHGNLADRNQFFDSLANIAVSSGGNDAHLDLAPAPFEILDTSAPETLSRVAEPALTTIERDVISASLRDPVWSLGPGGRVRRALHWIFDVRRPTPLADARLEALRRFAVLVRHLGDRLDGAETDRLALAGYSPSQIRAASRQVASPHTSFWD